MDEDERQAVMSLCASLEGDSTTIGELLDALARDAGHDLTGTGMIREDLRQVWLGNDVRDWDSVAFVASELISYYSARGTQLRPEDVPRWVLAVLMLRDAGDHGAGDLSISIGSVVGLVASTATLLATRHSQ